MQDDLRAELIKQFPSEVIETKDMTGKEYMPVQHANAQLQSALKNVRDADRN